MPSDDGGLDVVVEFCWDRASWRSISAIRLVRSATCCPSCSFSGCRRSQRAPRGTAASSLRERLLLDRFGHHPLIHATIADHAEFVQPPELLQIKVLGLSGSQVYKGVIRQIGSSCLRDRSAPGFENKRFPRKGR